MDVVQYGSEDTKTHRKIKHILGQKQNGKVGRLLVSELFTVGKGGWSGFPPHKHDTDRDGETHHDEVYNFRFDPKEGFALQLLQGENKKVGDAHHIVDGSTFVIDKGEAILRQWIRTRGFSYASGGDHLTSGRGL